MASYDFEMWVGVGHLVSHLNYCSIGVVSF